MLHRHLDGRVLVKLERGEEVLQALTELCVEHDIGCASLVGIGAVKEAELGYYDLDTMTYLTRAFPEIRELVSLVGNVALVDGKPFIHAHASLGDRDLSLVGGHLVRATVAVTVEAFVNPNSSPVERALDAEVKLKLLEL